MGGMLKSGAFGDYEFSVRSGLGSRPAPNPNEYALRSEPYCAE